MQKTKNTLCILFLPMKHQPSRAKTFCSSLFTLKMFSILFTRRKSVGTMRSKHSFNICHERSFYETTTKDGAKLQKSVASLNQMQGDFGEHIQNVWNSVNNWYPVFAYPFFSNNQLFCSEL